MKLVLCAALSLVGGLTACGAAHESQTSTSPATTPVASALATAPTTTPAESTKAAAESAFVLEVMGEMPELVLARPELVKLGHTTCQAFRDKPGSVQFLVDNMTKAGQTAEQIKTAKVVAIAAIHTLCADQVGDL